MPYNTRRKSLSLPRLGIHVPVTHAERAAANRSAQCAAAAAAAAATAALTAANQQHQSQTPHGASSATPSSAPSSPPEMHTSKKAKRSHGDGPNSPAKAARAPVKLETTPPPSPPPGRRSLGLDAPDAPLVRKLELSGINDEIVEAVVLRLQCTGNRPHLVKELAAVLMQQLRIVQQ